MTRRKTVIRYEELAGAIVRTALTAHRAWCEDRDIEKAEGLWQATQLDINAALAQLEKLKPTGDRR